MRILQVFGFFVILWQDQSNASFFATNFNMRIRHFALNCKILEVMTPIPRLKKHLFCDYDNTFYPNFRKNEMINVTLILMPQFMEFTEDDGKLSLHSLILITWWDQHLAWTPSDYDKITDIFVESSQIWTPDLWIYNPGDMSYHQHELSFNKCYISYDGTVSCTLAMKLNSKCDPDYTYWPYDKQQCRITFSSWMYLHDEVNFQTESGNGISMEDYENNTEWDLKFVNSVNEIKTHECCPGETFPNIQFNFLLTRHHIIKHMFLIIPALALMLFTLTVLCLDSKSTERLTMASMNFICHLLCMYNLYWHLPYNDVIPNILLFYRESLSLAIFAIILTALLRKLEDMNMKMPNWISFVIMFILSNKLARFLILRDDKSKLVGEDTAIEETPDVPKSEIPMKESSWKHFAAIVDWLSFFCVILTYVIILITLVPIS